jgi:hypothetical protein
VATNGVIIELDGAPDVPPGRDRRRSLTLAFAMCLAIASAGLGRDAPVAIRTEQPAATAVMVFSRDGSTYVGPAPVEHYLSLPPNTGDVLLSWIPERLTNEAFPPLQFVPVRVRAAAGLAFAGPRPGDYRMVTWTEGGNAYWLVSDRREIADLVRLADSLR